MLILMAFNFAFWFFLIGDAQNPQFAKNHIYKFFGKKNRFFQFVNFGVLQFKKLWKQSWMALELASVSSMISEILIKIGLKMTIFIHEFFGISLDASTVSLYNRVIVTCRLKNSC